MPITNVATYRILSNLLQTSFGKSSEVKYVTHYLSATVVSDNMVRFKVVMRVSFPDQRAMLDQRNKYRTQCSELISATMKKIEESYVEEIENMNKLLGKTEQPFEAAPKDKIKLKLIPSTTQESIEYLSVSNPNKQAVFNFSCVCEVT